MGRVRDWQDGHGQRSLVLEILDMKMIEIGLAQDRVSNGITINDIFAVCPVCPRFHSESIYNFLIRS